MVSEAERQGQTIDKQFDKKKTHLRIIFENRTFKFSYIPK